MTAVRRGVTTAIRTFNEESTIPVQDYGWDTYEARLMRYWLYESYHNNSIYRDINAAAVALKLKNRLYKNVRGVYNPVFRQNQLLVGYIYGGAIDMEHLQGGAIPIVTSNDALREAIKQTFIWSRWGENKSLYTRDGALYGDVAIKIIDDRAREKVRMEVMHPGKIKDVELNAVGDIQAILIEYEREEDEVVAGMQPSRLGFLGSSRLKTYTYTERITKDKFETFRNGEPFAYYTDMNGDPVSEWDNEYGFVPVVLAHHQPLDLKWGANAFYTTLHKIDEINDQASLLNDQIRKIIIPMFYAAGVGQKSEIKTAIDDKDALKMLYGPKDSSIESLVGQIDIPGALSNIDAMLKELERDLPELAFQRIREGGNLTAPGVRSGYSDAEGRIKEARGNYDSAQVRALQMAVSIGGYNRYKGFESFGLDSYDAGNMEFYIKDRPVISDELSLNERLTQLGTVNNMSPELQRIALQEMDYDEETIEAVVADTEAQTRNAARGFAQAVFGQVDNGDEEDQSMQQPQLPANSSAQLPAAVPAVGG